jgi:uncharacterized membrane protein YhhN
VTPAEWEAYASLWVPLLAAVLLAVVDWLAVWRGGRWGLAVERVAKPAVMLALLVAAVGAHAWTPEAEAARPWLVLALTASLAGDVLLLPPGRFVAGLAAFLLAHLAYLVAFLQLPPEGAWLALGVIAALALASTVGLRIVRAARGVGLGSAVLAYIVAICLMAVAATRTGSPPAIAGAWLFAASDAMLAWRLLVAPAPALDGRAPAAAAAGRRAGGGVPRVAAMATYHVGQILLVLALLVPWQPA